MALAASVSQSHEYVRRASVHPPLSLKGFRADATTAAPSHRRKRAVQKPPNQTWRSVSPHWIRVASAPKIDDSNPTNFLAIHYNEGEDCCRLIIQIVRLPERYQRYYDDDDDDERGSRSGHDSAAAASGK